MDDSALIEKLCEAVGATRETLLVKATAYRQEALDARGKCLPVRPESPCHPHDQIHHNASPSHAEGAWCNNCGAFAPLHTFIGSAFDNGPVPASQPYLADLRGIGDLLVARERERNALIRLAAAAGVTPRVMNSMDVRAMAMLALIPGADPRVRREWIDGPTR